ncbi:nitrate assimilation regulatory protein nirA [Beauveria bassiana ARSEF 2860]|uniref:Nitrate assimilation regulatory protein nirA n=1 Tax=Beauveria bassiana (strain ARSEF 2860) TaxID=655819 RepID=J5K520_BEAB2|nr:nitrate assimilation regulatory protein nirA [Beauveria bassiana ARSEF 2860]EJP69166.1 nitrate assimilation regulatory protein nirA [Beauveria bassiana ARSEF 2860]
MQKRYRTIQPSSLQPEHTEHPGDTVPGSVNDGAAETQPGKRRRVNGIACDNCRARKVACNRARPVCARCTRLNVECEYASTSPEETRSMALKRRIDELQQQLSEHADILQHLRTLPETDAMSVVRRLRLTPNASRVLSSLRGGAHTGARLSERRTSRGISPPTESDAEFELSVLHTSVYPALLPLDIASVDIDSVFPSADPVASPRSRLPSKTPSLEGVLPVTPQIAPAPPSPLRGSSQRRNRLIAGPPPDRRYCDARLKRLNIAYWTSIPVSDEFAACVLSHYLVSDHPIYACVDADLFLNDLVDRKLDYCSPFLVSALLSFACQSYTQFDARSSAFSVAFLDEAQRLCRSEQRSQTTNHLAALTYLALSTGASGRDEIGSSIAIECRQLAEKMNLMGVKPTKELVSQLHSLPLKEMKSSAFAAWGAYAWLTYRRMYYPIEAFIEPPLLPIPGDAHRRTDHGTPLLWPPHPLPLYMGQTYQTLSKLWVIIQEINTMYTLEDDRPIDSRVPLSYAESKYQSLLESSHSMLPEMRQGDDSPTHVLFFHALFHHTVLTLFQPFQGNVEQLGLRSFTSPDATPSAIYNASLKQLKRLIYTHHNRKAQSPIICFFNTAVMKVSIEVLKCADYDPDWYFYFRLCFQFWKDTFVCYRPFQLIAQANLAAALDCGALSSNTANAMMQEIRAVGKHHMASDEAVVRGLLDFDLATRSLQEAQIVAMAQRFDELLLFNDLTTGDL